MKERRRGGGHEEEKEKDGRRVQGLTHAMALGGGGLNLGCGGGGCDGLWHEERGCRGGPSCDGPRRSPSGCGVATSSLRKRRGEVGVEEEKGQQQHM